MGAGGSSGGTMQQSPSGGSGPSGGATQSGGATSEHPSAGSAQTEPQGGAGMRAGEQTKGKAGKQQGQMERNGSKQGANERGEGSKQGTNERHEGGTKQGASEQREGGTKQGANERGMNSRNVSLTTEQKTTIREKVLTRSAPRVGHVNFNIRVGTVVPRSVHFVTVPATLVTIEPQWRGYKYFVYADEIIIVNPRTLEIVAVLEV